MTHIYLFSWKKKKHIHKYSINAKAGLFSQPAQHHLVDACLPHLPLVAWLRAVQHNAAPATPPNIYGPFKATQPLSKGVKYFPVTNLIIKTGPSYVAALSKARWTNFVVTAKDVNQREIERGKEKKERKKEKELLRIPGKNLQQGTEILDIIPVGKVIDSNYIWQLLYLIRVLWSGCKWCLKANMTAFGINIRGVGGDKMGCMLWQVEGLVSVNASQHPGFIWAF